MNELAIFVADWIKGKSIYPAVRRGLTLLFCVSISSFLFEKYFYTYEWLNITDYKAILNFLIKGEFFIPFSLFLVVYGVTQGISLFFFYTINFFQSLKWTRNIIEYEIKRPDMKRHIRQIKRFSPIISPYTISEELFLKGYAEIRHNITPEVFQTIEKELVKPKEELFTNFTFIFRGVLALTVYYFSLAHFSTIVFLIVFTLGIIYMYLMMLAYRLLDVIPVFVHRFHYEVEKYFQETMEKEKSNLGIANMENTLAKENTP